MNATTIERASNRPIVVLGAEGQLGNEFCQLLGAHAIGLDLPQLDITDAHAVSACLGRLRPNIVINAAAYTRVDQAERSVARCMSVNADAVRRLAEECARLDAILVQFSTDYVFSVAPQRRPMREDDPVSPRGVYATSKWLGEVNAARCPRHLIVRTCGLYGRPSPRSSGNFVATMLRLAGKRHRLRVVDDQWCTPSRIDDVARATIDLIRLGRRGRFHLVNRGATTWCRFARELFRVAGLDVAVEPISTAEYGAPAHRPSYSVLDTAKFHAVAGVTTLPSWQDALRDFVHDRGRSPS